jgi:hypothetical protein
MTEEKGWPVAVKVASSTPEMRAPVSQGKRANATQPADDRRVEAVTHRATWGRWT